jgi:tetratricopeptide (TPR) repeat protein
MSWLDIENRAYLRAIQWQAELYQNKGDTEKAIELYRLLLKLNPNDNQGVRYTLAGIYAGISGEKINKMFDQGNKKQNWSKLEKLVVTQNKKYHFWNKSNFY